MNTVHLVPSERTWEKIADVVMESRRVDTDALTLTDFLSCVNAIAALALSSKEDYKEMRSLALTGAALCVRAIEELC